MTDRELRRAAIASMLEQATDRQLRDIHLYLLRTTKKKPGQ